MTPIVVVAAVIESDGKFLLTLRPEGTHLAGMWEFPGGKCMAHETHTEALRRELFEELDIVAEVGDCIYSIRHDYPDRSVELYFYECQFQGHPKPMLGQELQWVGRADLRSLSFPEADAALIELLAANIRQVGK
jgi:8-oxo-dGTP diphosphatase